MPLQPDSPEPIPIFIPLVQLDLKLSQISPLLMTAVAVVSLLTTAAVVVSLFTYSLNKEDGVLGLSRTTKTRGARCDTITVPTSPAIGKGNLDPQFEQTLRQCSVARRAVVPTCVEGMLHVLTRRTKRTEAMVHWMM
ncbi:hypothetical protein Hdeb2414_s0008g00272301 [Helianthus debilis subsp. tardiflorus]